MDRFLSRLRRLRNNGGRNAFNPPLKAGETPAFPHGQAELDRGTLPQISAQPLYPVACDPGFCYSSLVSRMDMKASWGMLTMPMDFMRFLPSFCFLSSFIFRVTSPP